MQNMPLEKKKTESSKILKIKRNEEKAIIY